MTEWVSLTGKTHPELVVTPQAILNTGKIRLFSGQDWCGRLLLFPPLAYRVWQKCKRATRALRGGRGEQTPPGTGPATTPKSLAAHPFLPGWTSVTGISRTLGVYGPLNNHPSTGLRDLLLFFPLAYGAVQKCKSPRPMMPTVYEYSSSSLSSSGRQNSSPAPVSSSRQLKSLSLGPVAIIVTTGPCLLNRWSPPLSCMQRCTKPVGPYRPHLLYGGF